MPLTRKNKKDRKNRTASRNNRKDRKDRKVSRKDRKDRKGSRKDRKDRKNRKCWSRKQAGGNPMGQSLDQGKQFMEFHKNQHGGAYLTGAPLSQIDGSMLEPGLRDFARVGGLDASVAQAATQRDPDQVQNGGRRNRKASKKSKKSKKNRKSRQAGGALTGAPFNQPTMLLTSAEAAKAGTADFSNPLLKY